MYVIIVHIVFDCISSFSIPERTFVLRSNISNIVKGISIIKIVMNETAISLLKYNFLFDIELHSENKELMDNPATSLIKNKVRMFVLHKGRSASLDIIV